MLRSMLVVPLLVTATAALGQTAFVPPGGTNPQGASGGITGDGRIMAGPPRVASATGEGVSRQMSARPGQVRRGYAVYSTDGPLIGRIAYADGRVAVVESPRYALRLPVGAFGIRQNGLLLAMTPARFDQLGEASGARR